MGKYYSTNKNASYDVGSDKPPAGGSRYSEDTPSFESLKAGNAGRGIQGISVYSNSGSESSRKQYEHEKASGADVGSYDEWKKL